MMGEKCRYVGHFFRQPFANRTVRFISSFEIHLLLETSTRPLRVGFIPDRREFISTQERSIFPGFGDRRMNKSDCKWFVSAETPHQG